MMHHLPLFPTMKQLRSCVCACKRCPRLVTFRNSVLEKKPFCAKSYWKKPVCGFGDPKAKLLILGLAPSAQGGNRTGRIFTGDASGKFLFQALFAEGFANQPLSESRQDGLELQRCYLTAAVKCVPPENKPTTSEFKHCFAFLRNEFFLLKHISAVLALGSFAMKAYLHYIKVHGGPQLSIRFTHGEKYTIEKFPDLYTCYHPSPQNTNTGKLNQQMLCSLLREIKLTLTQRQRHCD